MKRRADIMSLFEVKYVLFCCVMLPKESPKSRGDFEEATSVAAHVNSKGGFYNWI